TLSFFFSATSPTHIYTLSLHDALPISSAADFFDFQKQNTSFEQTVAWGGASLNLTGDGLPELVDGGRVSWNFFDTLGAKPILGRSEEHTSELQSRGHLVCRLLLEKKNK